MVPLLVPKRRQSAQRFATITPRAAAPADDWVAATPPDWTRLSTSPTVPSRRRMNMPVDDLRSKDWEEFSGAWRSDARFRVHHLRQGGRRELPGMTRLTDDNPGASSRGPSFAEGSDDLKRKAFWNAATLVRHRIELRLRLPLDRLGAERAREVARLLEQRIKSVEVLQERPPSTLTVDGATAW